MDTSGVRVHELKSAQKRARGGRHLHTNLQPRGRAEFYILGNLRQSQAMDLVVCTFLRSRLCVLEYSARKGRVHTDRSSQNAVYHGLVTRTVHALVLNTISGLFLWDLRPGTLIHAFLRQVLVPSFHSPCRDFPLPSLGLSLADPLLLQK